MSSDPLRRRRRVNVCLRPEELQAGRALAQAADMSLSRYLGHLLLTLKPMRGSGFTAEHVEVGERQP